VALSGVSHLLFVGCVLFTLDRVLSFLWDSMSNEKPHLLQKTREMGTPHSRSKARAALLGFGPECYKDSRGWLTNSA
jgi:hypothetical protein